MARRSEAERFFLKVKKYPGGCWEWQATCSKGPGGGYGVFYAFDPKHGRKRNMAAHRWSYLHHNGPIPENKIIMHTCDNRRCVNPRHLVIGTQKDNAQDMMAKSRWRGVAGEEHFNTSLSSAQIVEIRNRYASGKIFQYQLAEEFGVSQSTIGRIVRGLVWAHVSGVKGPGKPHKGERHHASKLKTDQVKKIRERYKVGGITQRSLAEEYGVSTKHIGEIIRGNKRKDE